MVRGRSGRRWRELTRQIRATETHCWRCGQRIDWSIPYRDDHGNVNQASGTVEHKLPLAVRPDLAEDRGNLAASHWRCNATAGARQTELGLGERTRDW